MTIEQLKYIVEVFKLGSISVAAEKLHVSQSGVSRAITNLENELGIKIFTRSKLGTLPTEKGKKIIKYAYEVLLILKLINEESELYTSSMTGKLKIATTTGYMSLLLKPLSIFKDTFPEIDIELSAMGSKEIITAFQKNEIDIGIVTVFGEIEKNSVSSLSFDTLLEGKMKLCVSKNSPLALHKNVTPQELLNHMFVVHDSDYIQWFTQDFCNRYGDIEVMFQTNNTDVIKEAILNNLAICFATDFAMKNDPYVLNGQIVLIDLWEHESTNITFGKLNSTDNYPSASAKKFINLLKSES